MSASPRGPAPRCWQARCGLWAAHARARTAGLALAALADAVAALSPGRALHVIAHSMGARVALNALTHVEAGRFGRIVLLAAAETRQVAAAALATPAGRNESAMPSGVSAVYSVSSDTGAACSTPQALITRVSAMLSCRQRCEARKMKSTLTKPNSWPTAGTKPNKAGTP